MIKNKKQLLLLCIALIFLSITIGYAVTSTDSKISGKTKLKKKDEVEQREEDYSASELLMNKAGTNDKELVEIKQDKTEQTSSSTEYRYMGKEPNNYIYFNCLENNCELWRIIGVFNNKLKIVKQEPIKDINWNENNNNWKTSNLYNYLNGTEEDSYYGSLEKSSKNYISNEMWYLGGEAKFDNTTNEMYKIERGEKVYKDNKLTTPGKVGLIYPSDYGYASSECYKNKKLTEYKDCISSNWYFQNTEEYTITASSKNNQNVVKINSEGSIEIARIGDKISIRPTVYLATNLRIEGSGTREDPYKIK